MTREIAIDVAREGMVLAADVLAGGRCLCRRGTRLDERLIGRLVGLGVERVPVLDDAADGQPQARHERAEARLRHLFRRSRSSLMQELFQCLKEFRSTEDDMC